MSWAEPRFLWALLLVPALVIAFALDGQRRLRLLERLGHIPSMRALIATLSRGRRRLRVVIWVTGVSLLLVGLARPQLPGKARLVQSKGLDLVVALDFSRSMLARDIYPTRLDRAKAELGRLIDTLKGDRVGLVAFAGETMSYPLTTDYEAAKHFWMDLMPDDMPVGGTDLGRALRASIDLLRSVEKKDQKRKPAQAIVLLTDGEDTEGRGIETAREAGRLGIRIYSIGIGTSERPIIQTYDENGKPAGYLADDEGKPVRVGIDENALKQMAQLTNGSYYAIDPDRFGMDRVEEAIAGLQRTEEEARYEREPEDIGRFLLMPGFLLLVAEACLRDRKSKAKPKAATSPTSEAGEAPYRQPGVPRGGATLLLLLLPWLGGWELWKRRDPNVEAGNQALAEGKAEDALVAYSRALTDQPDEPTIHYNRGVALHQLKRYPEAQKEFQRATESRDPQLKADAYYNLGNTQLQTDHHKEAIEAYKHTLQLRPDDKRAKWNLEMARRLLAAQPPPPPQPQSGDDKKENKDKNEDKENKENKDKKDQKDPKENKDAQGQSKPDPGDPQDSQSMPQPGNEKPDDKQKPAGADKPEPPPEPRNEKTEPPPEPADKKDGKGDPKDKEKPRILPNPKDGREIDKQDAESVLDALERSEPTVQKELARRRAGTRRAKKDW